MLDNFDNINGKSGEDTTPFIPIETAWASIQPELDKEAERRKKKKRRFVIFWFLFAALLLSSGAFLFNISTRNHLFIADVAKLHTNRLPNYSVNNGNNKIVVKEANNSIETNDKSIITDSNKDAIVSSYENKIDLNTANVNTYNKQIVKGVNKNEKIVADANKTSLHQKADNNTTTNEDKKTNKFTINTAKKKLNNNHFDIADVDNNELNVKVAKAINSHDKMTLIVNANNKIDTTITQTLSAKTSVVVSNNTDTNSLAMTTKFNDIATKKIDSTKKVLARTKKDSKDINALKNKTISYGIQFNMPFGQGVNRKDINAEEKPLYILIPQLWVAKQFGQKHSISLHINPYGQYFLNNKAVLDSSHYSITLNQGLKINSGPEVINYTEQNAMNKLITFDLSLLYEYQLSTKFKIGIGLSNCWKLGAIMQHKVIENNTTITTDKLYGVDKNSTQWATINTCYLMGKLEALYQLKKMAVGFNFNIPINEMFNKKMQNLPVTNNNLFLRYTIK